MTSCIYCHSEIDTEEYGWGWFYEGYEKIPFHMECIEVFDES